MQPNLKQRIAQICAGSQKRVDISMAVMERGAEKLEAGLAHVKRSQARLARLP